MSEIKSIESETRSGSCGCSALLGVTVGNGKYTVQQDASGRLTALRYGSPWRDCCGDGLIYQLAAELQDAREALQRIASYPIHSEPMGAALDMQEIAAALVTPNFGVHELHYLVNHV